MLALELGYSSRARMYEDLSTAEYQDWCRFASYEAIGYQRSDMRSAIVAQILANTNIGEKQKPYGIVDFMPFEAKPKTNSVSLSEKIKANFGMVKKQGDQ